MTPTLEWDTQSSCFSFLLPDRTGGVLNTLQSIITKKQRAPRYQLFLISHRQSHFRSDTLKLDRFYKLALLFFKSRCGGSNKKMIRKKSHWSHYSLGGQGIAQAVQRVAEIYRRIVYIDYSQLIASHLTQISPTWRYFDLEMNCFIFTSNIFPKMQCCVGIHTNKTIDFKCRNLMHLRKGQWFWTHLLSLFIDVIWMSSLIIPFDISQLILSGSSFSHMTAVPYDWTWPQLICFYLHPKSKASTQCLVSWSHSHVKEAVGLLGLDKQ